MTVLAAGAFSDMALKPTILSALIEAGYDKPTPIQAQAIPVLLAGRDVLGQAQTGTGKTAAFALPLLSRVEVSLRSPQVLVLAPTRELAIQVAEAFRKYAAHLKGMRVLPVYGGQDYRSQMRALQQGVHVVVGTPGRIMDHMRRGTLQLKDLSALVLDEADEMLRMGFIEDVEWILEQTPEQHQTALFSATMPGPIKRISAQYLREPEEITITMNRVSADTIRQRYWPVKGVHKLDALSRILEAEAFDAMIIFVRTKTATVDLAEKLRARGYAAASLNGDIPQHLRERTIEQLKKGRLDIVVATDVAARGLDVERISMVLNYDVPQDAEAYIHRIGRTGRAGRQGEAILFVAPRERRLLQSIERASGKAIEVMELPSPELINERRLALFKQRISDTLAGEDLSPFAQLIQEFQQESQADPLAIAAALACLLQGDKPLFLADKTGRDQQSSRKKPNNSRQDPHERPSSRRVESKGRSAPLEAGMERFRIEVGHDHGVKPGNIVGAIANEAELDSKYIGRVDILDTYSLVDLPEGMPKEVFRHLKKTWVSGQQLKISRSTGKAGSRDTAQPAKRKSRQQGASQARRARA